MAPRKPTSPCAPFPVSPCLDLLLTRRTSELRGVCTRMKTVEITRSKAVAPSLIPGHPPFSSIPSTWQVFRDLYAKEGLRGINKGVNAVALRQATNCASLARSPPVCRSRLTHTGA